MSFWVSLVHPVEEEKRTTGFRVSDEAAASIRSHLIADDSQFIAVDENGEGLWIDRQKLVAIHLQNEAK